MVVYLNYSDERCSGNFSEVELYCLTFPGTVGGLKATSLMPGFKEVMSSPTTSFGSRLDSPSDNDGRRSM